jgi:hypothetical protein
MSRCIKKRIIVNGSLLIETDLDSFLCYKGYSLTPIAIKIFEFFAYFVVKKLLSFPEFLSSRSKSSLAKYYRTFFTLTALYS